MLQASLHAANDITEKRSFLLLDGFTHNGRWEQEIDSGEQESDSKAALE